jgi:hypothetical protein
MGKSIDARQVDVLCGSDDLLNLVHCV